MDIKELNYFLKICETNSISKASLQLFITQQGLSKAIQKLENELQVTLMNRNHYGVFLTPQGEILKQHALNIIDEYHTMLTELTKADATLVSALHVTVELGILSLLSQDPFIKFMDEHSEILLAMEEHTEQTCEKLMESGKSEIGFASAPIDKGLYKFYPILPLKPVILLNKNHMLAERDNITYHDIVGENLLFFGSPCYYAYTRMFRKLGLTSHILVSSIEKVIHKKYLLSNVGICPTFTHYANYDEVCEDPNIVVKELSEDLDWALCMYVKKDTELTNSAKIFIEFVQDYFSRLQE